MEVIETERERIRGQMDQALEDGDDDMLAMALEAWNIITAKRDAMVRSEPSLLVPSREPAKAKAAIAGSLALPPAPSLPQPTEKANASLPASACISPCGGEIPMSRPPRPARPPRPDASEIASSAVLAEGPQRAGEAPSAVAGTASWPRCAVTETPVAETMMGDDCGAAPFIDAEADQVELELELEREQLLALRAHVDGQLATVERHLRDARRRVTPPLPTNRADLCANNADTDLGLGNASPGQLTVALEQQHKRCKWKVLFGHTASKVMLQEGQEKVHEQIGASLVGNRVGGPSLARTPRPSVASSTGSEKPPPYSASTTDTRDRRRSSSDASNNVSANVDLPLESKPRSVSGSMSPFLGLGDRFGRQPSTFRPGKSSTFASFALMSKGRFFGLTPRHVRCIRDPSTSNTETPAWMNEHW
jgi:hypothetical protein